uniref:Importin N-terminal domain-containing protein n=1 Tax=Plectus sambesii TaxID=2011161 RepID=A0A914VQ52_9BILA
MDEDSTTELVVNAIRCVYEPVSTPDARRQAHEFLEQLKESNANIAQIGFSLVAKDRDLIVRHCGWQLIEYAVKYKWNDLEADERLAIRNSCFQVLSNGLHSIAQEDSHVKEGIARSIVAMVKQEWPQNWPGFIAEAESCCPHGAIQTQIVFLVFLRLVQDVITLPNMDNNIRRRDLNNAIILSIPEIIRISIETLKLCATQIASSNDEALLLAKTVLQTLAELLEWVPAKLLEPELPLLLSLICSYLITRQHGIYLEAARCLWQLASRKKTKNEEAVPVLALFQSEPMQAILESCRLAAEGAADELHYDFLKTLCSLLSALGQHLTSLWGTKQSPISGPPENFSLYLSATLAFFEHPSLHLRNEAAAVLVSFTGHKEISAMAEFKAIIDAVLNLIPRALQKVGLPSRTDCDTCSYSLLDYDSDAEFNHDFTQFRDRCIRIVRDCLETRSELLYDLCRNWVALRAAGDPLAVPDVEWDAMNRLVRIVFDYIWKMGQSNPDLGNDLLVMLDKTLGVMRGVTDWVVLNSLLSTMSSLFVAVNFSGDRVLNILEELTRILSAPVGPLDDGLKAAKRHAVSDLLRLVTDFTNPVLPYAESVFNLAAASAPFLSLMQQANLMQVLASLSNYFGDLPKKKAFLASTLQPTAQYLASPPVVEAASDPVKFIKFIGLCDPAPLTDIEAERSPFVCNRRDLRGHCTALEGVLYQVKNTENVEGDHPAFDIVRPILPLIFNLARCVNGLYSKEPLALIHASYGGVSVVDIQDNDKQQVLSSNETVGGGGSTSAGQKAVATSVDHARAFIGEITDRVQSLIGLCISRFDQQFYALPEAGQLMFNCFQFLEDVLDFRLRYWIRRTWKPAVAAARLDTAPILYPCLAVLVQHMNTVLSSRWTAVIDRLEAGDATQEQTAQELFLEDMTCVLTREYVSMMPGLLACETLESNENGQNEDSQEKRRKTMTLNALGSLLMNDETTLQAFVSTLFQVLTWRDTVAASKAFPLCKFTIDSLTQYGKLNNESANFLLYCALKSLE